MHRAQKGYSYLVWILIFLFNVSFSQETFQDLFKYSENEFKNGNYADALNYNLKALQLAEKENNKALVAYGSLYVGRMYYFSHEKRMALNYFFKSRQIVNENKIDSLRFRVAYNIGVMYTELSIPDSALLFYEEANLALKNNPNYNDLAKLNGVIADLYLNQINDLELAKKYIVEAERYAEKSNDLGWKGFVCIKYSIYYKFKQDYVLSVKYARQAKEMFDKKGEVDGRMYSMKVLADALALNRNPEAKQAYEELLMLKDSVFGARTASKIAQYQTLYETDKKITENKLLQQKDELNKSEIAAKNKTIIGLLIGVLLIIITIFWRLSVINLKKKNRELEAAQAIQKEKERISRDLHDNVGGQLSYVLYSLDGINEKDTNKRSELTTTINESIRNVISSLRETIWAINDESINLSDFSDKLKVYARTIFKNTDTKIVFNEQISKDIQLNSLVGLNLYRICQEIINNAFKHAKASELKVDISTNDKTTIIVSDNGVGFDLEKQTEEGFGLSNIRSRAEEVGIKLDLKTELNKGVVYTLVV